MSYKYDSLEPPEDSRPVVYCCAACGEVIREGDLFWLLLDEKFCEECVDNAQRVADTDSWL